MNRLEGGRGVGGSVGLGWALLSTAAARRPPCEPNCALGVELKSDADLCTAALRLFGCWLQD